MPLKMFIFFLDFSHDGLRLIASGDDDSMIIYDCEKVIIILLSCLFSIPRKLEKTFIFFCDIFPPMFKSNILIIINNIGSAETVDKISEIWRGSGAFYTRLQYYYLCLK
jgi:hypothetical protein